MRNWKSSHVNESRVCCIDIVRITAVGAIVTQKKYGVRDGLNSLETKCPM